MSRSYAPWRLKIYCSECRKTTNYIKLEKDGEIFYECHGNPKDLEYGCSHRVYLKDGGDSAKVDGFDG